MMVWRSKMAKLNLLRSQANELVILKLATNGTIGSTCPSLSHMYS